MKEEKPNLFEALFDFYEKGIIILDTDLKIVAVNLRACELLGYTKEEITKLNPYILFAKRLAIELEGAAEFAHLGVSVDLEAKLFKKDGSEISTLASIRTVKATEGNFVVLSF